MKRQPALLAFATVAMIVAACTGGGLRTEVRGSGVLATETRPVTGFDRILVSGFGTVHVEITGAESLRVEAEDNILDVLTIEVVNGRLELGHRAFTNIIPNRDITYHITAASLDAVAVAGSGALDVGEVDAGTFSVSVSGSGGVAPSGRTGQLTVDISGSGRYVGADLEAEVASVTVSGSGLAVVGASESLAASVSGSGSIRYLGEPVVAPRVSGSGSISPRR